MFTVGIFSTHIPYIAFLLFYAYFFIGGINKAASGEISTGENYIKTEIYSREIPVKPDTDTYHFFCKISTGTKYYRFEDFLFKRKINYPEYSSVKIHSDYYASSLFNRPPPAV